MSLYYSDANKNLHKVAGNINLPTNVERVELVYDMSSSDSNINLNHKSGIPALTKVNVDLTKYKKLIVYAEGPKSVVSKIYYVDLLKPASVIGVSGFPYMGIGTHTSIDDIWGGLTTAGIYYDFALVNTSKTIFYHYETGYTSGNTVVKRNTNLEYRIYKIEGIY